jgi:hypothetical protein
MSEFGTTIEEVSFEIGFEATVRLIAVWGNRDLRIPTKAQDGHPIAQAIGMDKFAHLVAMFAGVVMAVPSMEPYISARRIRAAAALILAGFTNADAAEVLDVHPRQFQKMRREAEEWGLLALNARAAGRRAA